MAAAAVYVEIPPCRTFDGGLTTESGSGLDCIGRTLRPPGFHEWDECRASPMPDSSTECATRTQTPQRMTTASGSILIDS